MRLHAAVFALALAGIGSSIAIAQGPPPGSTKSAMDGRIEICHRTDSPRVPFRMLSVSRAKLESHMRHGDLLVPSDGACPTASAAF